MKALPVGMNPSPSRRTVLVGLAASASALILPRSAGAAGELNVLAWCDHADPRLIQPFEQAQGVKVNVKTYEGTGTGLSIIEQSRPGDWDVFMVDATDVPRIAGNGLFMELPERRRHGRTCSRDLSDPAVRPRGRQAVRDPGKVRLLRSLFQQEERRCRRCPARGHSLEREVQGTHRRLRLLFPDHSTDRASARAGSRTTLDAEKLNTIRELLLKAKPNVKLIGDIPSVQNALVTGNVDVIFGGAEFTVSNLIPANPQLDWVIFDTGGLIWTQGLTVLDQSKRKDLALEFIKWVIEPEGAGPARHVRLLLGNADQQQGRTRRDTEVDPPLGPAAGLSEELGLLAAAGERPRREDARSLDRVPAKLMEAPAGSGTSLASARASRSLRLSRPPAVGGLPHDSSFG